MKELLWKYEITPTHYISLFDSFSPPKHGTCLFFVLCGVFFVVVWLGGGGGSLFVCLKCSFSFEGLLY